MPRRSLVVLILRTHSTTDRLSPKQIGGCAAQTPFTGKVEKSYDPPNGLQETLGQIRSYSLQFDSAQSISKDTCFYHDLCTPTISLQV